MRRFWPVLVVALLGIAAIAAFLLYPRIPSYDFLQNAKLVEERKSAKSHLRLYFLSGKFQDVFAEADRELTSRGFKIRKRDNRTASWVDDTSTVVMGISSSPKIAPKKGESKPVEGAPGVSVAVVELKDLR